MTNDRAEMWAESLSKGDVALEFAEGTHISAESSLAASSAAQAHYQRAAAVQLDGIRRVLVEHFHDCDSSLGGNEP